MEQPFRHIGGSLNALLVLEAAVRHAGLSRAAQELNISQPAVSRHIAALEDRLGQSLFSRNNNRIVPTANAKKLAQSVALGFGHIDQVWNDISVPQNEDELSIACSFTFSDQWLMSRFIDLQTYMGSTHVRVTTSDRLEEIDLTHVDAAVVWKLENMPEMPYFSLIREEVFPICSPAFLKMYPEAATNLSSLAPEKFLHFDVGDSGFMSWEGWFVRAQLTLPSFERSASFDAYPFILQAVRRGEGVALGWKGVVDKSLEDGDIVRLNPTITGRDVAYYLLHRPCVDEGSNLAKLLRWFRQAASL